MTGNVRGKDLVGKTIVSSEAGKRFGEVADISFISGTGELMNLLIENATPHIKELNIQRDKNERFMVPFSSVKSVGDFVIVNSDDIV